MLCNKYTAQGLDTTWTHDEHFRATTSHLPTRWEVLHRERALARHLCRVASKVNTMNGRITRHFDYGIGQPIP
jgi:hypothetical protein